MKCRGVQKSLSEYVDGRLSAGSARSIEEHCASCDACANELAFLRAYRKRMSSLPGKTAPADFLEKFNRRLDVPEARRGIVRTLFSPARIKLPLEAAGLLAAAALVFIILIPDETRKADLVSHSPERVAVTESADLAMHGIDEHVRPPAKRRVHQTASRDKTAGQARVYVIAFTLRSASAPALAMNGAPHGRAGEHEEMKAADAYVSKAKVAAARQMPPAEEKKETAVRLTDDGPHTDIRNAIRRSGATIIEEKCDAATGRCSSITFEIRHEAHTSLLNELKGFGDARPERPAPKTGAGTMRIQLRFSGE